MSLAQRFERRLEGMVGSAFARVFKGQVEPVEIGTALQREAIDKKSVMGNGQILVPNRYRVTLSDSDYDRLSPWDRQLCHSLAELIQEHLDDNGLKTIGDIEVYLALDSSLHTGVFGVASRMEAAAPPRRRPYDSMSMPVVPGNLEEYVEPYGSHIAAPPPPYSPPPYSPPPYSPPAAPYSPPPGHDAPPYQPAAFAPPPHQPPAYQAAADYPGAGYPAPYPEQAAISDPPPYVEAPRRQTLRAHLVVDGTPRSVALRGGSNIVGRGSEADLQVLDQGVSRRHLDVHVSDGIATAYDLHSTNGTTVNGHPIDSATLQHGDVIRVGHTRLVYQQDS